MTACHVVINLGLSYSGVVIEQGEGFRPTKIKIPFGSIESAWQAVSDLDIDVIPETTVIPGAVVHGEIETTMREP